MPTALIIGASRGLGLGLVDELASRDWNVIATARNPDTAEGLKALVKKTDGRVRVEKADLDETADMLALHKRLEGTKLDLLFTNAGIAVAKDKNAQTWTRDEIAAVMTTNVFRTIGAAQIFTDLVKTGDGVIAFMSSRVGSIGFTRVRPEGEDLYRASKAALNALTRSFQMRLADQSITVLSVSPGLVKTDLTGNRGEIDVATATKGVIDFVVRLRGTQKHGFYRYDGEELPW